MEMKIVKYLVEHEANINKNNYNINNIYKLEYLI